jgi:hypothetical protein
MNRGLRSTACGKACVSWITSGARTFALRDPGGSDVVLCPDVVPFVDHRFNRCNLLQRSVIHHGAERKASSAIISTPHSGRNDRNGMLRAYLAAVPKIEAPALSPFRVRPGLLYWPLSWRPLSWRRSRLRRSWRTAARLDRATVRFRMRRRHSQADRLQSAPPAITAERRGIRRRRI